jgi:hypothetical protein
MRHRDRWIAAALLVSSLALAACTRASTEESGGSAAQVQVVEGSDQARVILSADAARRLGIETTPVREARAAQGSGRQVVPYAAVLYDPAGTAWVYTSPEPLVFIRYRVQVTQIHGSVAFLSSGPPIGTPVVTVGASELLGTEYEVGEE